MSTKQSSNDKYRFRLLFLHPRYWLTWLGLGFFLIFSLLPMTVLDGLGSRLGNFAARSNKKRFNIVRANLSLCFPDKSSSEIEEMVKMDLAQYPDLSDVSLDFGTGEDEGLEIWIDGERYSGVSAVPDDRIRGSIEKAVNSFND